MAALSLDDLWRSLKKRGATLAPVYYLYGDEDVLKEDAIDALVEAAVEPSTRALNYDMRLAGEVSAEAFDTLVETPPMLAERRLIVLRSVEAWKSKAVLRGRLERYLERPNPTTVLVLIQGSGEEPVAGYAARATSVAVEPLSPDRTAKWVLHRASRVGVSLTPEAVAHLLNALRGDLGAVTAELEKLRSVALNRAATPDDVAELVGVRRGETAFDLVDAVLEQDGPRAARLVRPVLAQGGISAVQVIALLGAVLIGVAYTRAEFERGRRGRTLEEAAYGAIDRARHLRHLRRWRDEAKRWAGWAEHWTADQLRRAHAATLAADRALKETRVTGEEGVLETLVLTVAAQREAA